MEAPRQLDQPPPWSNKNILLVFCSGPAPADGPWSLARPDFGSFWAQLEITANIAAPEHVGSFVGQNRPKIDHKWQGGMSVFPGRAFFQKTKKTAPPPKHMAFNAHRLHAHRLHLHTDRPKPGPSKIMVLGLIGRLVAPNRVLTGSPGRESRAGAAGGVGSAPRGQKWIEIFGDPAVSGRVWAGFSGLFLEWSRMVPAGPGSII